MDVMQGEPGRAGNPVSLPKMRLEFCRVPGNSELRIRSGDGSMPQILWPPAESVDLSIYEHSSMLQTWSGVHSQKVHEAPGEERKGLTGPIQFVVKLLEFWRLETDDAVGLLGFDSADANHVAAVLGGREQFRGRDVKDRIVHLFHIRATLLALFRDLETENNWLREPHAPLDKRSPLSLMLGGSMEDLLLTREYVESAAGR